MKTFKHIISSDNLPYEKVGKNEPVCIADEVPFDIPDSWEWVRLGSLADIFGRIGFRGYTKNDIVPNGKGAITISPSNIKNGSTDFTSTTYISWEKYYESPEIMIFDNDIIVVKTGSSYGKSAIVNNLVEKATLNPQLVVLKNVLCDKNYLNLFLSSFIARKQFEKFVIGTAIPTFSQEKLSRMYVPLPPLQEQQRIVEKLKELEPYINDYDKAYEKIEKLNTDFPDLLKKSILQEAVQGKLVPQDPTDEPASVLIEQIRQEKEQLIKDKKIKKDKNESYIFRRDNSHYEKIGKEERCIDDEIPFDIPDSWEWTRLGTILEKLTDGTHSTPIYVEHGIPFLSVKDISQGNISFKNTKYITKEEHMELYKRCDPKMGDILLTKVGTTGIPVIVDTDKEFSLFVSVAQLRFKHKFINPEYLKYLILSPLVQVQCRENTKGVGNKNWVMRDIANTLIVIPPFDEQKRIVEKVKQILPEVNHLK